MKRLGIAIGLLILFVTASASDTDSSKKYRVWFDASIGQTNSTKGVSCDMYGFGLTMADRRFFYTVKLTRNEEASDFLITYGPLPYETYTSIDATIGTGISNKFLQLQGSVGLGVTTGIKRGAFLRSESTFFGTIDYYEKDQFTALSIPLEVSFMFKPTRWLGLGVAGFGNLNGARTYSGYLFRLSLGRLR